MVTAAAVVSESETPLSDAADNLFRRAIRIIAQPQDKEINKVPAHPPIPEFYAGVLV